MQRLDFLWSTTEALQGVSACILSNGFMVVAETVQAEEVRQGLNYALRHALACTINCVLLANTHAYKCSWQLKPRFSRYFAGGSEGLSRSKGLLFEGKIMDLKIGLNCKSISVSHSLEVR